MVTCSPLQDDQHITLINSDENDGYDVAVHTFKHTKGYNRAKIRLRCLPEYVHLKNKWNYAAMAIYIIAHWKRG